MKLAAITSLNARLRHQDFSLVIPQPLHRHPARVGTVLRYSERISKERNPRSSVEIRGQIGVHRC